MRELLVSAIFIGLVAGKSKYCELDLCPNGKKHIACGNLGAFLSNCPSDKRLVNLSKTEIQLIVDSHNLLRNKIASGKENRFSPAARMATMVKLQMNFFINIYF